jgi:hypothetical protein
LPSWIKLIISSKRSAQLTQQQWENVNLNSRFWQIDFECDLFPHEDVRVTRLGKERLQNVKLSSRERRSLSSLFATRMTRKIVIWLKKWINLIISTIFDDYVSSFLIWTETIFFCIVTWQLTSKVTILYKYIKESLELNKTKFKYVLLFIYWPIKKSK